jgi:DSBA-like thioredoxin domain
MSELRIFSYLPNPRIWKATIAARLCGVEVRGASPKELESWLWDFDARPLSGSEEVERADVRIGRMGFKGVALRKTSAFHGSASVYAPADAGRRGKPEAGSLRPVSSIRLRGGVCGRRWISAKRRNFEGLLQRAAIDPEQLLSAMEEQETKDPLRRNTDEAVRRGVFGAPTFFVGQEMFWDNDRLDWVEEALRGAGRKESE